MNSHRFEENSENLSPGIDPTLMPEQHMRSSAATVANRNYFPMLQQSMTTTMYFHTGYNASDGKKR